MMTPSSPPSWNDIPGLARLMEAAYPKIDRLNLSQEELVELLHAIPAAKDLPPAPNDNYLYSLRISWLAQDDVA